MESTSPMNGPASEPARTATLLAVPRYLILFLGALIAIGPLSLDAYLPAMPAMAEAFGVGIVRLNDTISIYLVGYGLGVFFGGSFSDQIGRKRIGLIGLSIFAAASIAIGFSTTIEQVQWLRLVQAIGGGFSTVICMAIVRDVYPVLLRDCAFSECHGSEERFFRIYGPGRARLLPDAVPDDPPTQDELILSYDRARSMLAGPTYEDALLLRKPLEHRGRGFRRRSSLSHEPQTCRVG